MPAPSKYTFADLNTLIMSPLVKMMMHRPLKINSTDFDVPDLIGYSADYKTFYVARILPHWPFLGANVPIKRFLMMRSQVERALDMAFAATPTTVPPNEGDEPAPDSVQRLAQEQESMCITLRMTGPGDHQRENIVEFARECERHAVRMLHGESGVANYTQWLTSLPVHRDNVPTDLVGYTQPAPSV